MKNDLKSRLEAIEEYLGIGTPVGGTVELTIDRLSEGVRTGFDLGVEVETVSSDPIYTDRHDRDLRDVWVSVPGLIEWLAYQGNVPSSIPERLSTLIDRMRPAEPGETADWAGPAGQLRIWAAVGKATVAEEMRMGDYCGIDPEYKMVWHRTKENATAIAVGDAKKGEEVELAPFGGGCLTPPPRERRWKWQES